MVQVNGKEIDWTPFPEGWYLTDVQYHVLWKNDDTGAMFVLVKIPEGGVFELPHTHPQADQMHFMLSGEGIRDDGKQMVFGEGQYSFGFRTKGTTHGPPRDSKLKVTKTGIMLQYFSGPPTKRNDGETEEHQFE
jgi:hypothetical protein